MVLLGTVSLESLGLILDPIKRVLGPLPLVLGQYTSSSCGWLTADCISGEAFVALSQIPKAHGNQQRNQEEAHRVGRECLRFTREEQPR